MPKTARIWLFAAIVALVAVLNAVLGWSDALADGRVLAGLQALVSERPLQAGLLYVGLSVVGCVVLAVPGIVFALVAGAAFGAVWGTLLCWAAVSLGACLAFVAGRYFLKDALKPRLARSAALNRLLFEGAPSSDVYLLAVTRLVPLFPYNLQNFAYGITDIGFVPYAVYSALFMLPGTAAYTVAAAGLVDPANRLACFGIAGALLVATLAAAALLKRSASLS